MSLAFTLLQLLPRVARLNAARKLMAVNEDRIEDITVSIADSVSDLMAAARLVHDAYVGRGLTEAHPSGLWVTPHHLLPGAVTLIAKHRDEVVATLSIVPDDKDLGLPLEKIYGAEVQALRAQGRRLAEVGALTVAPAWRRSGVSFLVNKAMFLTVGPLMGVDDVLVAVHPSSESFYNVLTLRREGPVRSYPGLNRKAQAVLLRLGAQTSVEEMRQLWGRQAQGPANPFYMYVEREHAQIQLPRDRSQMRRLEVIRRRFALAASKARGDVLEGLPASQASALRAILSPVAASERRRQSPLRHALAGTHRAPRPACPSGPWGVPTEPGVLYGNRVDHNDEHSIRAHPGSPCIPRRRPHPAAGGGPAGAQRGQLSALALPV